MKKKLLMLISILLLTIPIINVEAASRVTMYIFYGDSCTFCHKLLDYMETLEDDANYNKMFTTVRLEVWGNTKNSEIMLDVQRHFGQSRNAVPYYVIGEEYFYGFDEEKSPDEIKNAIKKAYNNNAKDVVYQYVFGSKTTTTTTTKQNALTKATSTTSTTTFYVPTTTTTTSIYYPTTTKKVPTPDKNGNLPVDVIEEFIDLANNQDEKAIDYIDPNTLSDLENEETNFTESLINGTSVTYILGDYKYIESGEYDGEEITHPTYIYEATMVGTIGGYKIEENDESGEIWVTYVDDTYYVNTMNYGVELNAAQVFDLFGIFKEMLDEEFGSYSWLMILVIILIIILSLLPMIIPFIVFVVIIRSVIKASRQKKQMIEQGAIPPQDNNFNGQGY